MKERNPYFKIWDTQGASGNEILEANGADIQFTLDAMLDSGAIYGQRAFISNGEEVELTEDIIYFISDPDERNRD